MRKLTYKNHSHIKHLFIFFVIFASLKAYPSYAAGNSDIAAISKFHYFKGHIGLLVKQTSMVNPDICDRTDWYILPKDHPYYKEMVALIMAAHLSGQPLLFGLEGCAQNMPVIAHVVSEK
ncbi:hypothetical protein [Janthinobacterium lividum]|uniref:hypothetical protein n=1 Tax=Janthinobacterium lividum TaxID=29581 RepID=UPI001595054E|nr:hypothetical protein [Janthinobacterium lividum]QKY11978.1 hypothetical protein G8765_29240 [Janthinobacterium lividum]